MNRASLSRFWCWCPLGTFILAFLAFPLTGLAQPPTEHQIVTNKKITYKKGLATPMVLIYSAKLIGGKRNPSGGFDFNGEEKATLRLELRPNSQNSNKWKDRMWAGISAQTLSKHRGNNLWRPRSRNNIVLTHRLLAATYEFTVDAPGTYELKLPVSFFDTKDFDGKIPVEYKDWPAPEPEHTVQVPAIKIMGLKSADDKNAEYVILAGTAAELAALATNKNANPQYQADARAALLKKFDEEQRYAIYHDPTQKNLQNFINNYANIVNLGFPKMEESLAIARRELAKFSGDLPPPPPPTNTNPTPPPPAVVSGDARQNWELARISGDTALINKYLRDYRGEVLEIDSMALDSLICWTPAEFELMPKSGVREQIRLINFHTPAYLDIYQGRLKIDDNKLRDDHLLSIEILQVKKLTLTVGDKVCRNKIVNIPLDNLMSVAMKGDTIAGLYQFTFSGGKPPYRLRLYPDSTDGEEWIRTGITERQFSIHRDSLQKANLEGKYRAEAYSDGSDSPVAIAGGVLFVPESPTPGWVLPVLIVLAIGLLALLLLFILRRGNNSRRTIFDEA